jgi:uncharacterized protein
MNCLPLLDPEVLTRLHSQAQELLSEPATNSSATPSPCQSICVMDKASGWCTGCLRNINEIAAWGGLGDAPRRQIWVQIERRAARVLQQQEPS